MGTHSKKWTYRNVPFDYSILTKRYGISEVFARVLVNRGFSNLSEIDDYLDYSKVKLKDAALMKDLEPAVKFLKSRPGAKIMVVGDYDVDGVMSTYILVRGLRELGYQVEFRIPERAKDGYGIRDYMADEAKEKNCDILMTCDNGISAFQAIEHAKEIGLTVILTDHHEVPLKDGVEVIPPADFCIDPKQSDCKYPFKDMCGAGITYRFIQHMVKGEKGYNSLLVQLMIPAAIATVCDVVPLVGENRIITSFGLKFINKNCDILGLNKLITLCDFKRDIGSYDFGFRLGPCINASGRLESAKLSEELMLSESSSEAEAIAAKLVKLNDFRKDITQAGVDAAVKYIEDNNLTDKKVFLIYLPEVSEAVAGIVAGRIREMFYRPVFIAVDAAIGEEGKVKGSGRSILGYHMQKELNNIADLLIEFGGHALAAGFAFRKEKLEEIDKALQDNCALTDEDLVEKIVFDAEIPLADMTKQVVDEIALMEPFGQKNDPPKFAKRNILFKNVFLCGRENQVGRFVIYDEDKKYSAVDFNVEAGIKNSIVTKYDLETWENLQKPDFEGVFMDILYAPMFNDYNNTVQFKVIDAR